MFSNKNKRIEDNFDSYTWVRSAVLYCYNKDKERVILSIEGLVNLNDKSIRDQVGRLDQLGLPEDTKIYASIEGVEYRVH